MFTLVSVVTLALGIGDIGAPSWDRFPRRAAPEGTRRSKRRAR
jgi:hypothetical protein